MAFLPVIICFVAGLSVALAAIPLIQRMSLALHVRRDGFHHTHRTPVSRLGGLAFAMAFIVVSLCAAVISSHPPGWLGPSMVIFFTSLAMFALGFWDDLRALGATRKLFAQIAVALIAFVGGVQIQRLQLPFWKEEIVLGFWSAPVTVVWLVGFTNLINLIDGIDGLAAGVGLMLMSLLVVVGIQSGLPFSVLIATGLAGAQLGFLRYNFPPAKIYMGDGGAYFIGFMIGLLTIVNSQKGTIIAALITPLYALALPILDVVTAILRRGLRGLPIFRADKNHIHHKLLARGFSRRKTVTVLYLICLVCLAFAFAIFSLRGVWLPLLFGAFGMTMLITARAIDLGRDWLAVGRIIGNSIDLRKETRYALPLVQWLELEAERAANLDELWEGFEFICRKFRLCSVALSGALRKEAKFVDAAAKTNLRRMSYEMQLGFVATLEFTACPSFSKNSFELLTELAAEAWFRAVHRWQEVNPAPVDCSSGEPNPIAPELSQVPAAPQCIRLPGANE